MSSRIEALMRGLGQGGSLGLNDEVSPWLAGRAGAVTDWLGLGDQTGIPREYAAGSADADMRATERAENQESADKFPVTYRAGQIAGGVPSSIAMSGLGAGAPTLAARVASGGLAAGARGGIEGAGLAEDGHRLEGAARAAGPSAVLGMAGAAAPTAFNAIKNMFKGGPPSGPVPALATAGASGPSAGEVARGAQAARGAGTSAGSLMKRTEAPPAAKTTPPPRRGSSPKNEAAQPSEPKTSRDAVNPPKGGDEPDVTIPKSQRLPKIEHLDFDTTASPLRDDVTPQGATGRPAMGELMGKPPSVLYPPPTAVAEFDASMPIPPAGRTGMEQRLPELTDEAVENFTQQFGKRKPAYNYPQDYIQDYVRDELAGIAKRRGE